MLRRAFLALCLPLLVSASSPRMDSPVRPAPVVMISGESAAARRRAVAERYAPSLYQETLDPVRDLISAFDFDGDWDGANNAAHVDRFPLRAVVYYAVQETRTHWFLRYLPYHAVDYKRVRGHPHDTESLLLVVRKLGEGQTMGAQLELMETRFHHLWFQYAPPGSGVRDGLDDLDGPVHFDEDDRPMVSAQRIGHGLCGGFSPLSWLHEVELVCEHHLAPRLQGQGVVYRYRGTSETPSTRDAIQERSYALAELTSTLWAHADDTRTFMPDVSNGVVLATSKGTGASAEPPWAQSPGPGSRRLGEQFFDPAGTLARRFRFAAAFARDYLWNPYLAPPRAPGSS